MTGVERLNALPAEEAEAVLKACCGSAEWARRMAARRPFGSEAANDSSNSTARITGKIALAHLNEFPDYYTRLERMEEQAKRDHGIA